jgi:hypothetical protein
LTPDTDQSGRVPGARIVAESVISSAEAEKMMQSIAYNREEVQADLDHLKEQTEAQKSMRAVLDTPLGSPRPRVTSHEPSAGAGSSSSTGIWDQPTARIVRDPEAWPLPAPKPDNASAPKSVFVNTLAESSFTSARKVFTYREDGLCRPPRMPAMMMSKPKGASTLPAWGDAEKQKFLDQQSQRIEDEKERARRNRFNTHQLRRARIAAGETSSSDSGDDRAHREQLQDRIDRNELMLSSGPIEDIVVYTEADAAETQRLDALDEAVRRLDIDDVREIGAALGRDPAFVAVVAPKLRPVAKSSITHLRPMTKAESWSNPVTNPPRSLTTTEPSGPPVKAPPVTGFLPSGPPAKAPPVAKAKSLSLRQGSGRPEKCPVRPLLGGMSGIPKGMNVMLDQLIGPPRYGVPYYNAPAYFGRKI